MSEKRWTDSGAEFSECGLYRFSLWRSWLGLFHKGDPRWVSFCMLNPSTADAEEDDHTIRRCIDYAIRWGFDGVKIVNAFPIRGTDPACIKEADNPIGVPRADDAIIEALMSSEFMVCAWGIHGGFNDRDRWLMGFLPKLGNLRCLAWTDEGFPRHPLYLARWLKPVPYTGRPTD